MSPPMPLETATYISDLVGTNPAATDGIVQGDDHIRLLKTTIKASFPNVTTAVTATAAELNAVTGNVATLTSGKYDKTGGSISGAVTVASGGLTVTAGGLTVSAGAISFPTISETVQSTSEIATQAETNTGTDDVRIVSPLKLSTWAPAVPIVTLDNAADYFLVTDGSDSGKVKRALGGLSVAVIADQKAQNTAGGTFTAGAWQTRDLNTEVSDAQGIVTISANQFTLGTGTYLIHATVPAYQVAEHQARLYNVTDASVAALGVVARSAGTSQTTSTSDIHAIVVLGASKALRIEHRAISTQSSNGFGIQANLTTEQYTTVTITKIG